ncbi:transcriptional regulator [Mycetocola manganoxydans]|uniref:Transcriptional regulator n=1 Tax=Mycetocola manganoxydans TaxID=699879 RepID=A0A3L6ZJM0_9MICO|nr:helix-turn-helix domain-containing protein [Mycetocola manganoxydans]RLP68176.1 transcriptional regulator [Mycetocola manganoxydans]GHD52581.1 transcriptional regulator [Mycetocola manganoxydans]
MNDTTSPSNLLMVDAPHRELLDQVLDKWSLHVLDELCGQPLRFNELRRAIPAIGQKSLTATLRRLERNGMIERVVMQTRPVAVQYRIAEVGNTLNELIEALLQWTTEALPEVQRARDRFDAENDAASPPPLDESGPR